MSESIEKTISELQKHLDDLAAQTSDTKRTINSLCKVVGKHPIYNDVDVSQGRTLMMNGDEYYGKPLATVVREILVDRKLSNAGPANVNEIYDSMIAGGYQFDAKSESNAKRGLRISLAKNTATFHKLPNGKFGLSDWYSAIKTTTVPTENGNGRKEEISNFREDAEVEEEVEEEFLIPSKPR